MSRIFEALKKATGEAGDAASVQAIDETQQQAGEDISVDNSGLDQCRTFSISIAPKSRLVALSDERGLGAEKIRVLSTRLRHMRQRRPFMKLLITSSMKGEGKSLIATNLAITFAKHARQKTLLIDGDFRQPTIARLVGIETTPGVGDWWRSDLPLKDMLRRHNEMPLWFLPAGHIPEQPLDILQSPRLAELITRFSGFFQWILIDSPPLTPLADSTVWSNLVEGIVLVVRQGVTPTKQLTRAIDSLEKNKLLGVVVNESTHVEHRYYEQYYRRNGSAAAKE